MKRKIALIVLFLSVIQGAQAADSEVGSLLTARYGYGFDPQRVQSLELTWAPEIRWDWESGGRLTGTARLRSEFETGMQPSAIETGGYSSFSRAATAGESIELALRELYFEKQSGDWYMVLGKQQVVWGKADGLKVLDVVDPQSFREFILEDFDESRIPLWTVNLEREIQDWTLQLLWSPDQTYNALPKSDAEYVFTSPRLVPQAASGVEVQLQKPVRPNNILVDSDAGLRLSGFFDGWDLSLNYLYQYDNQPVLHQNVGFVPTPVAVITPRYHRTHVVGGTFSSAFGDWVARGELGYFTDHYFIETDSGVAGGVAKSEELTYVLGIDWSGLTDTFVSAQFFQSWLPGYSTGIARPELDTNLTFLIRRDINNDTLSMGLLWIANTNDGDGLVRPKVSYDLQDDLRVWSEVDVFYGDRKGVFGQFNKKSRVLFGAELGF